MRGRSLAKIGLRCGGKMNLGCGEEVKESFPKISNNIIFCLCFFFWEKLDNVVVDMEVGEGNLGTEKRSHLRVHKTHIIFHLNG